MNSYGVLSANNAQNWVVASPGAFSRYPPWGAPKHTGGVALVAEELLGICQNEEDQR